MQPEDFAESFSVSRETLQKMQVYHDLLVKWQKSINLVGPKTLDDAWARHFADSAQLAAFVPSGAKTLLDLGSGAGFPGIVLAIMCPDLEVHLVESDERKAQFLRTVSRETETPVTVHNARIEEMADSVRPDVITARALAPLGILLGCCMPWAEANPALKMVFPKGRDAEEEVEGARERFDFALETTPSTLGEGGEILCISLLRRRG